MKKILLAFDGKSFSKGALEFARVLNEKSPILLTGAFLAQVDYASLWGNAGGGMAGAVVIPMLGDEDSEEVKERVRHFESWCVKHHIEHRVHKDFNDLAMPELKHETRFADLLIISSETFYEYLGVKEPNVYLKELLYNLECPVVVVPENFEFPTGNVLAYDGSESSVFAIKQFAYLFPEFADNNTILVNVNEKRDEELPDEANIEELAARHFSNLTLLKLDADPDKFFGTWLMENKGCILVSGAFGRSGLSRLFRKSFVSGIISDNKLPVFIAHK